MIKRISRYCIVLLYVVTVFSFIWMDCTHTIREGNQNYSPESFSLSYSHPILWIIPILGIGMLLLPWFWRVGYDSPDNSFAFGIFPGGKSLFGKFIRIILTLVFSIVTFCAIYFTIWVSFSCSWYMQEDLGIMLLLYGFFGLIAFIINLYYGLFSRKLYRK